MFVNDIKSYSEVFRINDCVIYFVKYYLFTCSSNGNICVIDLCQTDKKIQNYNYFDSKIDLTYIFILNQ